MPLKYNSGDSFLKVKSQAILNVRFNNPSLRQIHNDLEASEEGRAKTASTDTYTHWQVYGKASSASYLVLRVDGYFNYSIESSDGGSVHHRYRLRCGFEQIYTVVAQTANSLNIYKSKRCRCRRPEVEVVRHRHRDNMETHTINNVTAAPKGTVASTTTMVLKK